LFDGRKLAGILCERVNGVDLIGIGANLNIDTAAFAPDLRETSTSLSQITHAPIDEAAVLIRLAADLPKLLDHAGHSSADLLREYERHHALSGQLGQVSGPPAAPLRGRCEGLEAHGRLLARTAHRLHTVTAGQVR